jgi:hypothetical protein
MKPPDDFPYTSDSAPCSYCGTMMDEDDWEIEEDERHTVHRCRDALVREVRRVSALAADGVTTKDRMMLDLILAGALSKPKA